MLLLQLKQYMQSQRQATQWQIEHELGVSSDVLEPMLAHWMRKGCLVELDPVACEQGRCGCDTSSQRVFSWV